jgi:gamma-glutamyl-gamma-aminobutyrate hydrolase PuuD
MTNRALRFYSIEDFYADPGVAELLVAAEFDRVNLDKAEVIVFNGGEDIGTSIYGEKPIANSIPLEASPRDQYEMGIFEKYKDPSILKVGICRGSQLLNCLNGGTLWQDVNNHGSSHDIVLIPGGETIRVTSTHHQMMRPGPTGQVLGVAVRSTRKHADGADVTGPDKDQDVEIVWYADTSTLCIQGHPEYVPGSQFAEFSIALIRHYQEVAELTNACAV